MTVVLLFAVGSIPVALLIGLVRFAVARRPQQEVRSCL